MKCENCKESFAPRKEGIDVVGGYDSTVELSVQCPHCKANYSAWVSPEMWALQE